MQNVMPHSLPVMRRVLADASRQLNIEEGSLEHEELAAKILELFETDHDAEEVLAAALKRAG